MLQGKVALVTGASAGIGREIAQRLAVKGAAVAIIARRAERLEALVHAISDAGGRALPIPADVTDEEALRRAMDQVISTFGQLDLLVNNAGTGSFGRAGLISSAEFDRIMAVNVRSVFTLSTLALPHLAETRGSIINLGSSVVERPFANEFAYMASKGAVAALTRGMAASWGVKGVRANLIQPGVIESEFLEQAGLPPQQARMMYMGSKGLNALPVLGEAVDVAEAVAFLASDAARFITGAVLNVDGGLSLGAIGG